MTTTPQPSVERIVPLAGHPFVVGIEPGTTGLVVATALEWARVSGSILYFGYADPSRVAVEERADGSVRHTEIDPDVPDDAWHDRDRQLHEFLDELCAGSEVGWQFRYLAGRADRALTHLARTVEAAAIVVGAKRRNRRDPRTFLGSSVGAQLSHHQHRPVLLVPVAVVDWKEPLL
ncbi:Universal stress protein family protein [Propionibacterium cyclohexanicum]|uniref:Universal stress protein family protein n=1 Tax=Propionibacterium cyclohexanicum TaxID=64702 RepID=A0A1H9RMF7_9ACTN|nr:universal stress protein [Propionibacterium cyclohexanicum]SER73896.1 Universal stress protein family protein [Propionibacterium cyclohexanicum]